MFGAIALAAASTVADAAFVPYPSRYPVNPHRLMTAGLVAWAVWTVVVAWLRTSGPASWTPVLARLHPPVRGKAECACLVALSVVTVLCLDFGYGLQAGDGRMAFAVSEAMETVKELDVAAWATLCVGLYLVPKGRNATADTKPDAPAIAVTA